MSMTSWGGAKRNRVQLAIDVACTASRNLLGPKAIAEDKTERTSEGQRRLDVLGYTIDLSDGLDNARVTISERNRLKAAYGFFSVDFSKPVPFGTMEKLASWSARYSFICVVLQPFYSGTLRYNEGSSSKCKFETGGPCKKGSPPVASHIVRHCYR